jgi:hypothetical protein
MFTVDSDVVVVLVEEREEQNHTQGGRDNAIAGIFCAGASTLSHSTGIRIETETSFLVEGHGNVNKEA